MHLPDSRIPPASELACVTNIWLPSKIQALHVCLNWNKDSFTAQDRKEQFEDYQDEWAFSSDHCSLTIELEAKREIRIVCIHWYPMSWWGSICLDTRTLQSWAFSWKIPKRQKIHILLKRWKLLFADFFQKCCHSKTDQYISVNPTSKVQTYPKFSMKNSRVNWSKSFLARELWT